MCPILECGPDIIKGRAEAVEVIHRVQTTNVGVLWNNSAIADATLADLAQRFRHFHVHDEVLDTSHANIGERMQRGLTHLLALVAAIQAMSMLPAGGGGGRPLCLLSFRSLKERKM